MKISIYQPEYPGSYKETLEIMESFKSALAACPPETDLLVLPEYANCPGMTSIDKMIEHCRKYNESFLSELKTSAADNNIAVCVNMLYETGNSLFNTTFFIDKSGCIIAEYKKTHLAYSEINPMKLEPGKNPVFIEFMGAHITFAVCFELYFAEYFETLAKGKPDIILSPSYQRSENSEILLKQAMGRALDSEAFLIRSSYSMGEKSITGGNSYIVNPYGDVLLNTEQETGIFSIDINPLEKRLRPLAHGLDKMSSRQIIENFRIPSLYRTTKSGAKPLSEFKYPRVCAHRGHSGKIPENTLPAFCSALAIGADEIEFDVRLTKDNKMIICHDGTVDRVSNATGQVGNFTFDEIRTLNAGEYMGWTGLQFTTPEEIFELLGGRIIMNIHVYETGENGFVVSQLKQLIDKYGISDYVYFAAQEKEMAICLELAPEIERCMLECFDESRDIVDIALKYKCKRVQHFFKVYSPEIVAKAKKNSLISNLFYEDDPDIAKLRIEDGIDTMLANHTDRIIHSLKTI